MLLSPCDTFIPSLTNEHRSSSASRAAAGKVCLSLLGTWSGPGWVPGVSTLSQVRHLRYHDSVRTCVRTSVWLSPFRGLIVYRWSCTRIRSHGTLVLPFLLTCLSTSPFVCSPLCFDRRC